MTLSPEMSMRPFLSACFALSAALAVAACQSGEDRTAPAADPGSGAQTAAEAVPGPASSDQPDTGAEQGLAAQTACRADIGEAAAARLVERCIQVSPATHPPCNADNPCALIQGEIDRSCKLWDKDPPPECRS